MNKPFLLALLAFVGCPILVGQRALAQSPEASSRDYDVYSAFLRCQLAGHNRIDDLRVGEKAAVLAAVTVTYTATTSPNWDVVKAEIKDLQNSTFEAFRNCQSDSLSISHVFDLDKPYDVASREDVGSVERFLKQYPENHCLIHFSCVGFNPGETQAFFIAERNMCHSGVQKLILMEKNSEGRWSVKNITTGWIE